MKKGIIILLFFTGLLSCIGEDGNGCLPDARIVFELADEYSQGDYDSDIGNDIHLQFFTEGRFSQGQIVPYNLIKGGKPYILKNFEGQAQLVAYAIPAGQPGAVMEPERGEHYEEQLIRMEPEDDSPDFKPNRGNLYMGSKKLYGVGSQPLPHIIYMIPCFAKVTVIIMDAADFTSSFPGTPSVGIDGTAGEIRIHDRRPGPPVTIHSAIISDDETYSTGIMYLLPAAAEAGGISVKVYSDSVPVLLVDTEEKSVAGKEFIIRIFPHNLTAEITVDGWSYKTQVTTP